MLALASPPLPPADQQTGAAPKPNPPNAPRSLKRLRFWLFLFVGSFVVETVIYAVELFHGDPEARGYVVNSVAKDALFAALGIVALADLARRMQLVGFIIFGHAVIVATLAVACLTGNAESDFFPPSWIWDLGLHVDAGLTGWLPFAAAFTAFMALLYVRARREAAGLVALVPFEAETIAALAEVTLSSPALTPQEIAKRVDQRWNAFPADRKRKRHIRAGFWVVAFLPLLWGRAPLPWMEPKRRYELVEKRLLPAGTRRSELGPLRGTVQASLRFVTQMIYLGYYDDPDSYGPTRYERFRDRKPGERRIADLNQRRGGPPATTPEADPKLTTISAPENPGAGLVAEYVVIGSGAGGSIVAAELVRRGKDVLLLDRGPYVPPSQVSENEAEMYSKLYADGALQLSTDFTFQVLQGMCVGGGTVINNGICLDMPTAVLDEWIRDYGADLDERDVARAFKAVRRLVGVSRLEPLTPLSRGTRATVAPRAGHGFGAGPKWEPLEFNMHDCIGCGNCNLGCAYGSKLSMIQSVLPQAQACGTGRLRVLPLCHVETIELQGDRARRLRCMTRTEQPRELTVHADTAVVLAAGAVHSSRLLMRSRLGGPNVGRNLSANLASFMTGVFDYPTDAHDGLQISHYVPPAGHDGHVLETFYNPVMSQALIMPGWLKDHERNMNRYDRLLCIGALVRSHPDERNRVRAKPHPLTGSEFDFRPTTPDVKRLVKGLKAAGEELFAKGATEVMPATFEYHSFKRADELDQLDELIQDAGDLGARTAHPQGGNGISQDPAKGVVDMDFKVHGTSNLHVTDASVFPSAIQVNPQLTVMALAYLAAHEDDRHVAKIR